MNMQSNEALKQFWEDLTPLYVQDQATTSVFYMSLINLVKIQTRKAILDVGAGAGFLFDHSLKRKNKEATYVATDICENMLKSMCQYLNIWNDSGFPITNNQLNLTVQTENAEQLSFKDEQFDCYISNMVLHCVIDPEKMVKEAYRVLQKGGVLAVSVYAGHDRATINNIVQSTYLENGIDMPQLKQLYRFNEKESLIELFEQNGFKRVSSTRQFNPYSFADEESFNWITQFHKVKLIVEKNFPNQPEKLESILGEIRRKYNKVLLDEKSLVGVEAHLLIAFKE